MGSVGAKRSGGALAVVPDTASPPAVPAKGMSAGTRRAVSVPVEESCNEVRLIGRLGVGLRELTLPSGDNVVTFHLVVSRPERSSREQERRPREPRVDTLACAAWTSRCRRSVLAATPGDLLEVEGSLRRRFRRASGGSPVSFYEVEVAAVRRFRPTSR